MKFKKPKVLVSRVARRLERLPSGRVDAYDVLGMVGVPDRPLWLLCDCLERADRLSFYPHRGFCLRFGVQRAQYNAGHWAFCVFCRALMDSADILAARSATLTGIDAGRMKVTFVCTLLCICGDPVLWESGQPRIKSGTELG